MLDEPETQQVECCRFLVADQLQGDVYFVALHDRHCQSCARLARSWLQQTVAAVQALQPSDLEQPSAAEASWQTDHSSTHTAEAILPGCEQCTGFQQPEAQLRPAGKAADRPCSSCISPSTPAQTTAVKLKQVRPLDAFLTLAAGCCLRHGYALLIICFAAWLGGCMCHRQACKALRLQAEFVGHLSQHEYKDRVGSCLEALQAGDSYELCLTTTLTRQGAVCPRHLYRRLRAVNPAPMAAFLEFGGAQPLAVRPALWDLHRRSATISADNTSGCCMKSECHGH